MAPRAPLPQRLRSSDLCSPKARRARRRALWEFSQWCEPVLHREERGRSPVDTPIFLSRVLDVPVRGLGRDPEHRCDLLGLQPSCEERDHLGLALSAQPGARFAGPAARPRRARQQWCRHRRARRDTPLRALLLPAPGESGSRCADARSGRRRRPPRADGAGEVRVAAVSRGDIPIRPAARGDCSRPARGWRGGAQRKSARAGVPCTCTMHLTRSQSSADRGPRRCQRHGNGAARARGRTPARRTSGKSRPQPDDREEFDRPQRPRAPRRLPSDRPDRRERGQVKSPIAASASAIDGCRRRPVRGRDDPASAETNSMTTAAGPEVARSIVSTA